MNSLWPLHNIRVVLVGTRFPENIGMAARACANMGCPTLCLVAPEWWSRDKAVPLATAKGIPVLDNIRIFSDLQTAIADCHMAIATTARLGGWRENPLSPGQAAEIIMASMESEIALIFGPEDRGLNNADIAICPIIAHIPTSEAASLNLAQSVLIMLYECFNTYERNSRQSGHVGKQVTLEDMARLERMLKEILLALECLHGESPEYYFLQWQRILRRACIRRSEYDALMGFVRQLHRRLNIGKAGYQAIS